MVKKTFHSNFLLEMAVSAHLTVEHAVPGVTYSKTLDFNFMCEWYMNSFFPDFTNDSCPKSANLVTLFYGTLHLIRHRDLQAAPNK